jgi:hypothetical protein
VLQKLNTGLVSAEKATFHPKCSDLHDLLGLYYVPSVPGMVSLYSFTPERYYTLFILWCGANMPW